ncbi:MAG TPA: acyltransferase family protein [Arenimonas sp.]|uniref:acyltransferase family protein n=1 Tax=Arenimonas sp. TaxID=1872635 RepID=UPI002BD1C516|nr:acyltransferase family protein [Arenimonas sp.]HMB55962.1 acyltransferase family protein [Arenimonas sp.]
MLFPFPKASSQYRADIDGLRAIAITTVVAYHANFPWFSGGFVGVDIFFVISGFLITALLFNEELRSGRIDLAAFYARRVRRLMPAGLLVIVSTMLLAAFLLLPTVAEQLNLIRSAGAAAFFSSNFFFWQETGGYFDGPAYTYPLLHTWSLAVEEQYYLVWPFLLIVVYRYAKAATETGNRLRIIALLALMFFASLALSVYWTRTQPNAAFYLLPTRVWEFAIGGIVGLSSKWIADNLRRAGDLFAVVGLAAIGYSVFYFTHATPFPGSAALVPVLGTIALLAGTTANDQGQVRKLLSTRPFVVIGLLSYSWYLWHWPLLSISRIVGLGIDDVGRNALMLGLALLLAYLTYIFVENPIRERRPGWFAKSRSTLAMGAVISAITLASAIGLLAWREHLKTSSQIKAIFAAVTDASPYQSKCSMPATKLPTQLPLAVCVHGPDKTQPQIMLWGDSHADHLMPMLMEKFPDRSVYEMVMPGCAPSLGQGAHEPGLAENCAHFNQLALQRMHELRGKGLQGVLISARWARYASMPSLSLSEAGEGPPASAAKIVADTAKLRSNLDESLSALTAMGLRVVVMAPTPEMIYPVPQCLARRKPEQCETPRAMNDAMLADVTKLLREVVAKHPGVTLIDPIGFFCDSTRCYPKRDNTILYFDDDHVTGSAARLLAHAYAQELDGLRGDAAPVAPTQ